ncbi:uncharacterized protein M6D78_006869 isoform 2-T2 [Vipera latastei]
MGNVVFATHERPSPTCPARPEVYNDPGCVGGGGGATAGDVLLPSIPRLATARSFFGYIPWTSPIAAWPVTSQLKSKSTGRPDFPVQKPSRRSGRRNLPTSGSLQSAEDAVDLPLRPRPREGEDVTVWFGVLFSAPLFACWRSSSEREQNRPEFLAERSGRCFLLGSSPKSLPKPVPSLPRPPLFFRRLGATAEGERSMDWDTRLSSILVETDSNMAKIKEHLNTDSISSKADLLVGRINIESTVLTQPQTGLPPLHFTCGTHLCCRMANEELSTISQQLHSQAQIIESLTQAVCRLKQEKEQQQQSINHLVDEMDRLQHNSPGGFESLLGCSMKGMKSEFRGLQQQVLHQSDGDCTPDLFSRPGVMQDMLESKKILWQEYECIKREIEQLKHKLDCQEDELYNQVSATHEIKRIQNRYCKMLEELINTHKTQVQDFDKTRNETQNTQQELSVVKSTVTDLKEQVKCLSLEDKYTMQPKEDSTDLE